MVLLVAIVLVVLFAHQTTADGSTIASNLQALRAASTAAGSAILLGHTDSGDGGGGVFAFNAGSTAADDGGCVVAPSNGQKGRWIRDLGGGPARPEYFCGRVANVSTIDACPCFQAALSCTGWVIAGHGEYTFQTTLIVGTGDRVSGVGPDSTNLTLAPGANTDLIRSRNFQDLHDRGVWFVDEGMITGIEIRDVALFGNAALDTWSHSDLVQPLSVDTPRVFRSQQASSSPSPSGAVVNTAGTGIRLHAKRYVVSNVLIFQFAENCFYSEAGAHTGQNQAQDMPEATIGPLWVRDCWAGNFEYQGPHDGNLERILSAGGGGNGITITETPGLTTGECDIGFIHVYSARGYGVFSNVSVQAQYLITESNAGGGWLMLGHTMIGMLKAFSNREPSAASAAKAHPSVLNRMRLAPLTPSAIIDIQADRTTISHAFIAHSANGTAVRISGTQVQMSNAFMSSSPSFSTTGVRIEANQVRFQGVLDAFTGGDGCIVLGHPANQLPASEGVSMSRIDVAASGCETSVFNYSLAGANNDVQIASYVNIGSPSSQWVGANAQPTDRIHLVTRGTTDPPGSNSSWTVPDSSTAWVGTVAINVSIVGSHSASIPHGLVRQPMPSQCIPSLSGACFASGGAAAGPWITGTSGSSMDVAWYVMEPCTSEVILTVTCNIESSPYEVSPIV